MQRSRSVRSPDNETGVLGTTKPGTTKPGHDEATCAGHDETRGAGHFWLAGKRQVLAMAMIIAEQALRHSPDPGLMKGLQGSGVRS